MRPRCISCRRPRDFDVIVTENMFGDILTDEASMLAGSMGLLPSASLGAQASAADCSSPSTAPRPTSPAAASPILTPRYLSAAMLLRYALKLESEARLLEAAVSKAIDSGVLPADLAARRHAAVTTRAAGDAVLAAL